MNKKTNNPGYRSKESEKFESVPFSEYRDKQKKRKLKVNDIFEE